MKYSIDKFFEDYISNKDGYVQIEIPEDNDNQIVEKSDDEEQDNSKVEILELQDIFPLFLNEMQDDLVYSLVMNFYSFKDDEEHTLLKFQDQLPA